MNFASRLLGNSASSSLGLTDAQDPWINQEIKVANQKYTIRRKIGSGGFADVYSAQDSSSQEWVAIKRIRTHDEEGERSAMNELRFCKTFSNHPSIMKYVAAAKMKSDSGRGTEYTLVTELCSGGSIIDLLQSSSLSHEQIVRIFYGAATAIAYMHSLNPPITNRDVKIENLLIDSKGFVKLCDFGSATLAQFQPTADWTVAQRNQIEEEYAKHTTPMYRAPEILETYQDHPIGPAIDIWALGCVLYYLCYRIHPFEDSAKLRICNAKMMLPKDPSLHTNDIFRDIFLSCLKVDPRERPTAGELVERIEALAVALEINPKGPMTGVDNNKLIGGPATQAMQTLLSSHQIPKIPSTNDTLPMQQSSSISARPSASVTPSKPPEETAATMLGAIKGGGLSLFKNFREKTAAVVSTVQSTYGSKGPALIPITSRVLLSPISEGIPEALAYSAEEALKNHLASNQKPYLLINLSRRDLRCEYSLRPHAEPMNPPNIAEPPSLEAITKVAKIVGRYLSHEKNGVIVFYGVEENCILMSAVLLIYFKICARPYQCFELINTARGDVEMPQLPPSYHNLLDTVVLLSNREQSDYKSKLNNLDVYLTSLSLSPIPILNRSGNGCRPLVEIFRGTRKIFATAHAYEETKEFSKHMGYAKLELLSTPIKDEFTILVSHARHSSLNNTMTMIPMFSITLNSRFLDGQTTTLSFSLHQVDVHKDVSNRLDQSFKATLNLQFGRNKSDELPESFRYDGINYPQSSILFFDSQEYGNILRMLEASTTAELPDFPSMPGYASLKNRSQPSRPPAPLSKTKISESSGQNPAFFNSLFDNAPEASTRAETSASISQQTKNKIKKDELSELIEGIHVSAPSEEETPIFGNSSTIATSKPDVLDLFGVPDLSSSRIIPPTGEATSMNPFDPFADLLSEQKSAPAVSTQVHSDRLDLLDWNRSTEQTAAMGMHRNASAPTMQESSSASAFDPFAEFLATTNRPSTDVISGRSTPSHSRPNYSRSVFENVPTKKVDANAFEELLTNHNFTSSAANRNRKIGDMQREEVIKGMDPVSIKVRDWTSGKERNIRALLGSLNDVLWEGAAKWEQPSMSSLLTAIDVKKSYRKACLVVHPDKQTGEPHEALARAIFTELNDAWGAFEETGKNLS